MNYIDFLIDNSISIDTLRKNSYFLGEYQISAKNLVLHEVKIKKKRYNDTTRIDLSKRVFERSVMVSDLFSSQMGFSKDAKGQLYFKGKAVSDVLVNNGSFFGKNNMDIYSLLPALVINNIEVTESDIDSVTNTTMLRPTVKVNISLKDKFNKGKFGNANIGGGTLDRYLVNANLYTYRDKEQFSISANSNNVNIGDNLIGQPIVKFSTNSNYANANSLKLFYRNILFKKIEIEFTVKGNFENKDFRSESERQDQTIDQFSKVVNTIRSKTFGISETGFSLNYKIDPLNTIAFSQKLEYNKLKETDSLNYNISFNGNNTVSQQFKNRNITNYLLSSKMLYSKRFTSKKGRLLTIDINKDNYNPETSEINDVVNLHNDAFSRYFVNGRRHADESDITLNTNFTEPIGDASNIVFFAVYKTDHINYQSDIDSDTIKAELNNLFKVSNQYYQSGIKVQKTFDKISLNGAVSEILNLRSVSGTAYDAARYFHINSSVKLDYKINSKKNLLLDFITETHYPDINQLTNITNTFDLISQMNSNVKLIPEQKTSIRLEYNIKKTDQERLSFTGGADYFRSKFGSNITYTPNGIQNFFLDNIGNSKSGQLGFSIFKNITDKFYLNYNSSISYQETPAIVDRALFVNNGVNLNQSFSTSKEIVKSVLSITPVVSFFFNKSYYNSTSSVITNIIYSDNIAVNLYTIQINLYPYANYNHSITNNLSFSMNAAIKKNILKKYGTLWIQGYDIFNSFKFNNNYAGSTYTQSTSYSNLNRYIIIGFSLQFNNMK
ncbi:outer membrane beta-barrel protein [Mucilaginibacter paludis]|uniref:outer membrane beta-barrel protein n=1 Tax=Mucilaginibacter paludis TaxID=423351 RepID=UPI0012FB3222|nr:outer membrane beta-barrel protein [Mucilaginibacter paludis]